MGKLLITSQYNKLMKIPEPFEYDQPYDDKLNVFHYTRELEELCQKYDVGYYCLEQEQYNQMS